MNVAATRAFNPNETALVGIYEISKLLASPDRLERTLAGVLVLLSSFLDMRHGLIALLDGQGAPAIVVGSGWCETNAKKYFERLPERVVGQIVATKMPLVIENVSASPLFEGAKLSEWGPSDDQPFSLIGVPIKNGEAVVGTLTIDRLFDSAKAVRFDHDVRFLTMVANLVGQTLRLHNLIARDRERLIQENARLEMSRRARDVAMKPEDIKGIVGDSPAIQAVIDKVRIVAKSRSTVVLRGETGTGKEVFATALHKLSPRHAKAFIKVNCAALSADVLESELFGHERGAFTGAANLRQGRFELADGGTLFLDEIGEITPAFQAKLLRVLQEGEFERVGGTRTIKVNVRLICATNRNLEEEVQKGAFRADLYYRISVVPIFLPPLRERKGDIASLANKFLRRFNAEQGAHLTFSRAAIDFLTECDFPGNIRELENYVLRAATFASGDVIVAEDFSCLNDDNLAAALWSDSRGSSPPSPKFTPLPIRPNTKFDPDAAVRSPPSDGAGEGVGKAAPSADVSGPGSTAMREAAQRAEREKIIDAMERAGWMKAKAARLLGLTPRQIGYALTKYNIAVKRL